MGRRLWHGAWAAAFATGISGCVDPPAVAPVAVPVPPVTRGDAAARPISEESAALRSYLGQVQSAQLSQGLLRADGGGPDTPFTAAMLARNFESIVFFNEYDSALLGRGGESPLRRWQEPVRIGLVFGATVPASRRSRDTQAVRGYATRLADLSGHPISLGSPPNFIVIVADEDDRAAALAAAAAQLPDIGTDSLAPLRELPRNTYCAVAAFATGSDSSTYTQAVALIRDENPGLLRLSCIHEELAQALGLANDSRQARPSIFNDDDEFALLTDHDALLLRMLYDPRLQPGMTADDARPAIDVITRELVLAPL